MKGEIQGLNQLQLTNAKYILYNRGVTRWKIRYEKQFR